MFLQLLQKATRGEQEQCAQKLDEIFSGCRLCRHYRGVFVSKPALVRVVLALAGYDSTLALVMADLITDAEPRIQHSRNLPVLTCIVSVTAYMVLTGNIKQNGLLFHFRHFQNPHLQFFNDTRGTNCSSRGRCFLVCGCVVARTFQSGRIVHV